MPSAIAIAAILPIIAVTLVGDYYVKLAADGNGFRAPVFYLGAAFYATSACGLLIALRHMTLASVGVWYAMLTVIAMTGLGVFVFKESLGGREVLGLIFCFAALACMSRFA